MDIKITFILCIAIFFGTTAVNGQLVSSNSELNTAITNATAGTTITLANQTWTDVQISINKTGTSSNPITIEAETTGSVFIEGNSFVKIGGEHIILKGLVFQNPSNLSTSTPLIDFRASSTECNNCTVTGIKVDAFNGTASQETQIYKWILLRGQNNEVSYSSFIGKNGVGSIINDNRSSNVANFHKIHHNYFAERVPVNNDINGLNDQDAIRIGSSSTSLSDSFSEIYDNYFYDFSGEVEVISNKSGNNKYYNNTFEDYQGTLTLRHGNGCDVFNNFFFANNNEFSGGIRVIGEDHKVYNNYIEGVNHKKPGGAGSGATGGINVSNGKPGSALNEYYQVKNVQIVNNTLVNCDLAIRVGTMVNSSLTLAPENLVVANNIMLNSSDSALQEITAPTGTSIYEGNIKQNGTWDIPTDTNGNIDVTSGLLASGTDFYRIVSGSDAIDAGIGSYSFLTTDITGGPRPANYDAGAEEFGSGGTTGPYTQADVGVKVGFGASETLSIGENILDDKLKVFPNPITSDYLNVSLENISLGKVEIFDVLGRTVLQDYFDLPNAQIDISHLSQGIYTLKVKNISNKIIKQ